MTKPLFPMLAGYNAWANERVYDAAEGLSDADYRADRGAFFRSFTAPSTISSSRTASGCAVSRARATRRTGSMRSCSSASTNCARRAGHGRADRPLCGRPRQRGAGRTAPLPHDPRSRRHRAAARAGADAFLQPPDPSPRVHGLLTGLTGDAPSLDLILFQRASAWAFHDR